MIEVSSLALVFAREHNQFLDMHGSLANGGHYKTVHRNRDSEKEEESLHCRLGISSIKAPLQ